MWFWSLVLSAAAQQAVHDPWRTLETEHFRVHYPRSYAPWATASASRLEDAHARVIAEVGYRPERAIDVVVLDPVADANGMALPFLHGPRMVLWATPPEAESVIGHYREWSDLLVVHEDTHLVHLLRPSRNPWAQGLFYGLTGLGPIAIKAPRWVTEGYATVVEGRLTGSGRPNSDLRASILRRWAAQGRMPTYGQLSSDSQSFYGMSMAYLAGSAYLEWLDRRVGGGSFPKLWARMSAREDRSFEDAFAGVYGDEPAILYDRFVAELTYDAVALELERPERTGSLVFDLPWSTDLPAVHPDGSLIAAVVGDRDDPAVLKVWEVAVDQDALDEADEARTERLAKDPEDVSAVDRSPPPHHVEARLPAVQGAAPMAPRFVPGTTEILFARRGPDGDGVLRRDLYRWDYAGGGVERVTRFADLWDADPSPDGTWAAAVQIRHGLTDLVRVDLTTGAVTSIDVGGLDRIWSVPRVSPDGRSIAVTLHEDEAWHLVIVDAATGARRVIDTPGHAFLAHPAWAPDGGSVFVSRGETGFIDVWRLGLDGSTSIVTRSQAAAMAPTPTPDGTSLYYLALEPGGMDVRQVSLVVAAPEAAAAEAPAAEASEVPPSGSPPGVPAPAIAAAEPAPHPADAWRWPALRMPPETSPTALEALPPPDARPYGLGRQEPRILLAETATVDRSYTELGVRVGDMVGRIESIALFGLDAPIVETTTLEGDEGASFEPGGSLAIAWRGLPVTVAGAGWWVPAAGLDDTDRAGGQLSLTGTHRFPAARLTVDAFGGASADDGRSHTRFGGGGRVALDGAVTRGRALLGAGVRGAGDVGVSDGPDGAGLAWLGRGDATLALGYGDQAVRGGLQVAFADGPSPWDLVAVGGLGTSMIPDPARLRQVDVPALAHADVVTAGWLSPWAAVGVGGGVELFFSAHHWIDPLEPTEPLDLVGARWQLVSGAQPIARLPGVELDLGAAWRMDQPLWPGLSGVRGWIQLRYAL